MSYRMHLETIPALSPEGQQRMIQKIIRKLSTHNADEDSTVPYYSILNHIRLSQSVELGKNPVAEHLLTQCEPFFTDAVRKEYPWLTADPKSPAFVGIITKDMLLQLIRDIHQYQIDTYKTLYDEAEADPQAGSEKFIQSAADSIVRWNTSKQFLREDKHGSLILPSIVADSIEYQLFQLYAMYNRTLWSIPDDSKLQPQMVVLYGW